MSIRNPKERQSPLTSEPAVELYSMAHFAEKIFKEVGEPYRADENYSLTVSINKKSVKLGVITVSFIITHVNEQSNEKTTAKLILTSSYDEFDKTFTTMVIDVSGSDADGSVLFINRSYHATKNLHKYLRLIFGDRIKNI